MLEIAAAPAGVHGDHDHLRALAPQGLGLRANRRIERLHAQAVQALRIGGGRRVSGGAAGQEEEDG